ncbi:MAG: cytochrome C peroxidase, partial [Deltaproteobacteria bacterium]|nr:cytochrome C peroxidase [Deltaproteobacteria bacterium]
IEGLGIFVGKGNCHFCHLGPALTSGEFHNIGLGSRDWLDLADRGRFDGIPTVLADPFNGAGQWSDDPVAGTEKLVHLVQGAETMGQYKVPTLRNVALTAPYMHGGHFATLEEVVRYYSELDELTPWGHREDLMVQLDLTDAEIAAVVIFLESLTGDDLAGVATGP